MFLFFYLLLMNSGHSDVDLKSRTDRAPKKVVEQIILTKQSRVTKVDDNSHSEQLRFMNEYIERASKEPAIWDLSRRLTVKSTTTLRGRILNSVLSTNLESPMIVELLDDSSSLPIGTVFSCRGSIKHKRVFSACNRIILPDTNGEEFPVVVSILNLDGSAGVKADYYYTGKEEMVAGVLASAFIRGVVENSQERVATPLGQVTPDTVKNRFLTGTLSTTDQLTNMMTNEMKTREPKAYIEAGKNVLIFFNERLEL